MRRLGFLLPILILSTACGTPEMRACKNMVSFSESGNVEQCAESLSEMEAHCPLSYDELVACTANADNQSHGLACAGPCVQEGIRNAVMQNIVTQPNP